MFGNNDDFLKAYTVPPEQREAQVAQDNAAANVVNTETAPVVSAQPPETTPVTPTPVPPQETQKVDEFIESLNKDFGTSFKTRDDVKAAFGYQQKIAEYEPKVKLADDYKKKIEDYEKQFESYKDATTSEFLSKPRIRQAYVAQQLIDKYPDKDADVLQQIVMADVSKMSDLQVLVKNQKIDLPTLPESDIELALKDKYGIDPDARPEEWSSIAKTKIAIDAASARANIKTLTSGIQLPKTVTEDERRQAEQTALQQRIQAVAPLKDKFVKFDKFSKDGFEYDTPADYKGKLDGMFQAMFIDAGMEPTPENLETAIEMRDALFVLQNFGKIKEVIAKQAQTETQKKLDEALSNTKPPNTATATDEVTNRDDLPGRGLSAYLSDMG